MEQWKRIGSKNMLEQIIEEYSIGLIVKKPKNTRKEIMKSVIRNCEEGDGETKENENDKTIRPPRIYKEVIILRPIIMIEGRFSMFLKRCSRYRSGRGKTEQKNYKR